MWLRTLVAGIACLIAHPRPSSACTPPSSFSYGAKPNPADQTPPAALVTTNVRFGTACGVQYIEISLENPQDDVTKPFNVGVQFQVLSGTPPRGLILPGIVTRNTIGAVFLHYDDDEPFEVEIALRPVDEAGNVGPPTNVHLVSPDSGGCSATPGAGGGWMLALLALLVRRRA